MFVRTATRRNKDGSAVRYLQLVHNEWDPAAKAAKMKVLHNFGREDQIDKAAIERLAGSLCRLLDPGRAAVAAPLPPVRRGRRRHLRRGRYGRGPRAGSRSMSCSGRGGIGRMKPG